MKKLFFLLGFLVLFLFAYLFYQQFMLNDTNSYIKELPFTKNDGKIIGIINIGEDSELYDYSLVNQYFDEDVLNSETILMAGSEKYFIFPRYKKTTFKIYLLTMNDNGDVDKTFIKETNKPFYVVCNVSDIFSNVLIEIEYNNQVYEYSPYISLKDGTLYVPDFVLEVK
jgi:hypothetical protein